MPTPSNPLAPPPGLSPAQTAGWSDAYNRMTAISLADALKATAGTAILGGGLRGLRGLYDQMQATVGPPPRVTLPDRRMRIPRIRWDEEEEDEAAPAKAASGRWEGLGYRLGDALGLMYNDQGEFPGAPLPGFLSKVLTARGQAMRPNQQPIHHMIKWPGMLAGGLGGYWLADKAFDAARRQEVQSERDQAERRFEQALAGKTAAARHLNTLFALKTAQVTPEPTPGIRVYEQQPLSVDARDISSTATTAVPSLLAALAGVGGVGGLAFGWTMGRHRTRDAIMEEAAKKRRQQLFSRADPPILEVEDAGKTAGDLGTAASSALQRLEQRKLQQWAQIAAMLGQQPATPPPQPAAQAQAPNPTAPRR